MAQDCILMAIGRKPVAAPGRGRLANRLGSLFGDRTSSERICQGAARNPEHRRGAEQVRNGLPCSSGLPHRIMLEDVEVQEKKWYTWSAWYEI